MLLIYMKWFEKVNEVLYFNLQEKKSHALNLGEKMWLNQSKQKLVWSNLCKLNSKMAANGIGTKVWAE